MTNDKQIDAVAEAIESTLQVSLLSDNKQKFTIEVANTSIAAKAAIEASHAKYVPELVEALKMVANPLNMSCKMLIAENTLAKLPEELRG